MPDDRVTLVVDGTEFDGWTGATINRAIDKMAATFSLEYTDRWAPVGDAWPIEPDSVAEVKVSGTTVLTGFVARTSVELAADEYTLTAEGYSSGGLLQRTSALHKTGQWRNVSFVDIVRDLIAETEVPSVTFQREITEKVQRFEIEDGETVAAALERLCRMFAVLVTSAADGGLEILRTDSISESLTLPANPVRIVLERDHSERHNRYIAKGQLAGTDDFSGKATVNQSEVLLDEGVNLNTPLIISAEGPGGKKRILDRANYERNVRAGRSQPVTLTFPGARDANGVLFRTGRLVDLSLVTPRVTGKLMVSEVETTVNNDEGLVSRLTLVMPETFSLLDLPQRAFRQKGR